jgi:hypothetical protein
MIVLKKRSGLLHEEEFQATNSHVRKFQAGNSMLGIPRHPHKQVVKPMIVSSHSNIAVRNLADSRVI